MILRHCGITIDSEKPVTGVLQNHNIEWIHDEMVDGINIDYEEWIAEEKPTEEEQEAYEEQSDTYLIGDWILKDGKYTPSRSVFVERLGQDIYSSEPYKIAKGYAAIMRESVTQVVWSQHTMRARMCSPCYPGQADVDTPDPDGQLCYTLPPDVIGEQHSVA